MSDEDWAEARAARARGDHASEAKIYRRLAEDGDPRAQDNLGVLYERGLGVARSYSEAVKWYRMAADQNEANAQNKLGRRGHLGAAYLPPSLAPPITPLDDLLTQVERRLIEHAMQRAGQNKSRAAELLGISRPRLYRRIKELNLPDEPEPYDEPSPANSNSSGS